MLLPHSSVEVFSKGPWHEAPDFRPFKPVEIILDRILSVWFCGHIENRFWYKTVAWHVQLVLFPVLGDVF